MKIHGTGAIPGGRRGVSLVEVLAIVTLLGILALIVVPRFGNSSSQAKAKACFVNKGNIEVQAQLWFRNKGAWPADGLSNIGSDTNYFPDGLPTCPVEGSNYQFDSATQRVVGHQH